MTRKNGHDASWTYRMWTSLRRLRLRESHPRVANPDVPLIRRLESAIRYLESRQSRQS